MDKRQSLEADMSFRDDVNPSALGSSQVSIHQSPRPKPETASLKWSKAKALWLPLLMLVVCMVFLAVFGWYVYASMVAEHPSEKILLSASNANILVSILSQAFALGLQILFSETFNFLRWQLASRAGGVSASTFFALSSATGLISVFMFTLAKRFHSWGMIRLLFIPVGLFLGSILKYQAAFLHYFSHTRLEVPVFAGLTPLDLNVLRVTPARYICLYFTSWLPVLLDVSKYAISKSHAKCTENCVSVFLPGGLELARKVESRLNWSLLKGHELDPKGAVRINNAKGFHLTYQNLDPSFYFDRDAECRIYGQQFNDSILICARDVDRSIAVGWAACPYNLHQKMLCSSNTDWSKSSITEKVVLTAYAQRATTLYNSKDFAILDTQLLGNAEVHPLEASVYREIWEKIFVPTPQSPSDDQAMIQSLTWSLGWLMRLYDDDFPNDNSTPLAHLRNFLAIPIQFTIACVIHANSTTNFSDLFSLPDDMITTAETGLLMQRFVGQKWTLAVFISIAGILIIIAFAILAWIITDQAAFPSFSDVPEIDILVRAGDPKYGERINGLRDLLEEVRSRRLIEAKWPHRMTFGIRRIRLLWQKEGNDHDSTGGSQREHSDNPEEREDASTNRPPEEKAKESDE